MKDRGVELILWATIGFLVVFSWGFMSDWPWAILILNTVFTLTKRHWPTLKLFLSLSIPVFLWDQVLGCGFILLVVLLWILLSDDALFASPHQPWK